MQGSPTKLRTPNELHPEHRPQSPSHSSKSHDRRSFGHGLNKLKLRLGMSAETLVSPDKSTTATPPRRPQSPQRHHHRNVYNRLQALFPSSPTTPPTHISAGPPILPVPKIPTLDITSDVLSISNGIIPAPPEIPFLKIRIISWNHGYTLPKGDLSTLLGHVPVYEPPPEPLTELPIFSDDSDLYHIVIVAGQECPSQSNMPLALGGGLKFDIRDKERRLEKKKSKQGGKPPNLKDRERDAHSIISPSSDAPTTPLPSKDFSTSLGLASIPPSPALPPGSPYQHAPGPSSYSLKSAISQNGVSHAPIGWAGILEDWFSHGVGSIPGAAPFIPSDTATTLLSTTPPHDAPVMPKPIPSLHVPPPELDLASPMRSPTPDSPSKGGEGWKIPVNGEQIVVSGSSASSKQGPYVLHAKERLMAIALYIFVHRDIQHLVTGTSKSTVTAGLIGGRIGNKGGVGVSMKVAGTSLLFINAHLAAHEDKQAERVANLAKIKAELELDAFLPPGDPRALAEDITDRFDHSFIFGDLNFRLHVTRLHAEWLISRKDYANALMFDQLKEAMKEGEPFTGFEEAPIDFPPTFKYDIVRTVKKHGVRAFKDKAARRLRRRKEGIEDDDSTSTSSSSSDEDDRDHDAQSLSSSAHKSVQSHRVAEEDEEEDDAHHPLDTLATQNAIANSAKFPVDMHAAAHKAKEKFLALVNRPGSPAPSLTNASLSGGPASKRPKSIQGSPKPPPSPLIPPPPLTRSAASSIEIPRRSGEGLRPPQLKRAQSTKSGVKEPEEAKTGLETSCDVGVYDTSSKRRVPSWCDRILFKSNVLPEPEVDHERQPSKLSQLFHGFKRPRRDSTPSSASSTDSPVNTNRQSIHSPTALIHDHNPLSPTTSKTNDSPSRPSPLHRIFRQETAPLPPSARSPTHPKNDRSTSLNIPPRRDSSPMSAISDATATNRRSFTATFVPSPAGGSRPGSAASIDRPLHDTVEEPKRAPSTGETGVIPPWKWNIFRFGAGQREPSSHTVTTVTPSEPPPPAHHKGEVVCLKYDTLDDRQMRQLEARSDHRPVVGEFAVYI